MIRALLAVVFLTGLTAVTGCATTHKAATGDQLQARVVELEKKLEEKDSEIVDLQYEVKDLSSKVGSSRSEDSSSSVSTSTSVSVTSRGSDEVIRVSASAHDIQSALKAAGFYTGKVDGKIGSGTKAAIVAFQKSQGLASDGVVGRKTWEALKQYSK